TLIAQGIREDTAVVTKGKKEPKARNKTVRSDGHWRSADGGRTWTPVSVPQLQGSYGGTDGLVRGPGRFFLTREARRVTGTGKKRKQIRYAVVFGSSDGVKWTAVGRLTGGDHLGVDRLSGTAYGLAALVRVGGDRTAVMRSADGRTWQRVADIAGPRLTGLAALPSDAVVTGRRGPDAYLSVPGRGDVDLTKVAGAVRPDRTIAALSSAGGRLVAAGSTNGDAAAWVSRDGRAWRRARGDGFAGADIQRLAAVAPGAAGWMAVGLTGGRPLVLTSADGAGWARSPGLPDGFRPSGATYGRAGYVVVGRSGASAGTWSSADLKAWTGGSGDLGGTRWMNDVTAAGPGYVAVGGAGLGKGSSPAVWTSADGVKWSAAGAVPVPDGTPSGGLAKVVARGDTLVAAAPSFVSVSADGGRTWRSRPLPGAATVAVTSKGFVVAGTAGAPGRTDVVLWASGDGSAWRPVRPHGHGLDGPGAQRLTALATLGDDLLAVGVTSDDRGETPTLWRTGPSLTGS
ncbi:MAG: hypothetical protein JWO67_5211, partial [Streptosporangiaceae bacterium]|nr:hypothetical protein [Streptosporangiaceae bacterium]